MDVDGSGMVDQDEAVAWLADFDYFSQVCGVVSRPSDGFIRASIHPADRPRQERCAPFKTKMSSKEESFCMQLCMMICNCEEWFQSLLCDLRVDV